MASITHIGFAASRRFPSRLFERWRKVWASQVLFILQDELVGPLAVHLDVRGLHVSTLQEFERRHTLVGAVQPKGALGPALVAVIEDRYWARGGKRPVTSAEVVCEVLRRGQYPGAFSLRPETTASELLSFLQRPPPLSRDGVRLFHSRTGEPRSTPPRSTPPRPDE